MSSVSPPLCVEHLRTFAAWMAFGPCTVHQLAGRSDLPVIELHPRTEELLAVGGVAIVGQATTGPIFRAVTSDCALPSTTDLVERKLNTLPVRDQVSIAAGIMARHGRRGRTAREHSDEQAALSLPSE
jgi:hypothetical protein